jgi:hypothetical protein
MPRRPRVAAQARVAGAPFSEARLPAALTERLLDVLLDTRGIVASFVVNDAGELLCARHSPSYPPGATLDAALEAVAGLRLAASSGLEATSTVVAFRYGLLFARRFRRSHLCAWATEPFNQRALDMTARLVVGSLPDDARLDAISMMSPSDEEEDRITRPWLPESATHGPLPPTVSLRAPRVPRELLGLEQQHGHGRLERRDRSLRESGLRRIAPSRFSPEDD